MYKQTPHTWFQEFAGRDISGKDFSGYDLTGINLEASICRGCSFRGAMLAWAILHNAYMKPVIASSEQLAHCEGFEADASEAVGMSL